MAEVSNFHPKQTGPIRKPNFLAEFWILISLIQLGGIPSHSSKTGGHMQLN